MGVTDTAPVAYETYLLARLLEELTLADEADDPRESAIHLQACFYYRDLLKNPDADRTRSMIKPPRPLKRSKE